MKILVTGANGYLGQGVVKALLDNGHNVVATDFKTTYVDDRAEKVDGDLFSVEEPYIYFGKPDVLLHLAWRDGYKSKRVNSSYGSIDIDVPQDRKSTFEPQIVKKRQKDISDIDQKIISMYAKGMTTRQMSETIEDIYGFETSEGFISDVTDKIMPQIEDWQNRPLDEVYPILYMMRRTF